MSTAKLEQLLQERAIRRTGELTAAGVNSRTVRQALEAGTLVRPKMSEELGHVGGILAAADADIDPDFDDALAMILVPGGVIARCTAALRQGLGEDLPRVIEVLTPHKVTRLPPGASLHLMRSRREAALTEGVAARMTELGVEVRMTTPARTVVDLFRSALKQPGHVAHANAALAAYLAKGKPGGEVLRLSRFFEDCVQASVESAVYAATEALTKGHTP